MAAEKTETQSETQKEGRPEPETSVLEAWLELKRSMKAFLPEEFWKHRRAAQREALMACRALLDAAIEHLEKQDSPPEKRARKINIE